jgi:hypothetical protein
MMEQMCRGSRQGRWALGMALALAGLVLAGCDDTGNPFVVSLQPFYTAADLETDPQLQGIWIDKDGEISFTFDQKTDKEYQLTVKEREGGQELSGEFEAHLVRLGATWFLDLLPRSASEGDEFYRIHFLRAHSIARIEIGQDSLQTAFLSASWLKKKIEEKNVDTPHENADGSLLLTGTTEEVQELAFFYGNNDEAFADPLCLERQQVEEVEQ